LYHGTSRKNLQSILENGLDKRSRQHVHLSEDRETAMMVGRRSDKNPVILMISAMDMHYKGKHKFYLSENGVWLTDHVPKEYIRVLEKPSKEKIEKTLYEMLDELLEGGNQDGAIESLTYDEKTNTCTVKMSVHIVEEDEYIGFLICFVDSFYLCHDTIYSEGIFLLIVNQPQPNDPEVP